MERIHFLNTIWSDAILLESDGHFGFVDTGSSFYFPMIKEYLDNLKIKQLDFIILTHFHSDHYGNIIQLLEEFEVDRVYLREYSGHDGTTGSGGISSDEYHKAEMDRYLSILNKVIEYSNYIKIDENLNRINLGHLVLNLYNQKELIPLIYEYNDSSLDKTLKDKYYHKEIFNENAESVGIFIKHKNHSIYLAADMPGSMQELEVVSRLNEKIIRKIKTDFNLDAIDIYKAAHHGGPSCTTKEVVELLNPKYAIITNTNRWLDNYQTIPLLMNAKNIKEVLKTDHYQYIFDITEDLKLTKIEKESLFLLLGKN